MLLNAYNSQPIADDFLWQQQYRLRRHYMGHIHSPIQPGEKISLVEEPI
jgi:hypothetical protein